MERYRQTEKLTAAARKELPRVAVQWLAAARSPLEELTMAALNPELSDAEFRAMVEGFSKSLPGLLESMDPEPLAMLMEETMGAAMANGMGARQKTARQKTEEKRSEVKGKMPWETEWLGGGFDENKHKREHGRFASKGREWQPTSEMEAGVLSRLTGKVFKAGARIFATPDGIRHANKGHAHQLQEKDWQQLRGRMFDPRTKQDFTLTKTREPAISFQFQRGKDQMEAVFTIHKPPGSPGELRLKTYAMRN